MTTQTKLAALLAAAEEFLAADDKFDASLKQIVREPDHGDRWVRRIHARLALREMVLDLKVEAADRKMGGSLSPKSDAVKAAAKAIAFRNLKTALEMDPADTRGLPTLNQEKGK